MTVTIAPTFLVNSSSNTKCVDIHEVLELANTMNRLLYSPCGMCMNMNTCGSSSSSSSDASVVAPLGVNPVMLVERMMHVINRVMQRHRCPSEPRVNAAVHHMTLGRACIGESVRDKAHHVTIDEFGVECRNMKLDVEYVRWCLHEITKAYPLACDL